MCVGGCACIHARKPLLEQLCKPERGVINRQRCSDKSLLLQEKTVYSDIQYNSALSIRSTGSNCAAVFRTNAIL